ncbi:MAG: NADH-quinone oxidoreductase subunit H [Coriobacteriaceae bacterium]|nr:NADH-quinone oxidoreductase subunit H [Coriobacteriaceae bacterium]
MEIVIAIVQALLVLLLAPLISGMSRKIRAKMHTRQGPPLLQDYYDIGKLFKRQDVHTSDSSLIHRIMPPLYMGCMLVLAAGMPMVTRLCPVPLIGDMILIIYLLALPRFFFSLASVDSGASYSGIGGARELVLGVLVEPAMMLSLFVVALATGTTNVGDMGAAIASGNVTVIVAIVIAGIAFLCSVYVELGKLPFDLAEAEQELMEGPLSEYSGPSLGMLKMSMSMKQIIMVSWLCAVFIPWGSAATIAALPLLLGLVFWLVKIFVIFFIVSIVENLVARVRFKLAGHQTWAFVGIAAVALVFCLIGL